MNISYSRPLELGWRRMKRALFQPFDLGHWFGLGFTAWLAQLGNDGGGSGGSGYRLQNHLDYEDLRHTGLGTWHWFTGLADRPLGLVFFAFIAVGVILVTVLVIWLSSRGRFMFLDNLVHSRAEATRPWREFRAQGDSLFLWRIGYAVVAMITAVVGMGGLALVLVPAFGLPDGVRLITAIGLGITGFLFLTTVIFIDYFLDHFVVPIMYQRRIGTTAAWGVFLDIFGAQPGAFVLFGLFYLAILMAMGAAYFVGGALTCCVGLILLAIPYIGTVVSLPIFVLGQFMNLEFLAQFGDDFTLLPPLPGPGPTGSGQFDADGAMVRTMDVGEDAGSDQAGPQNT